MSLPVYVRCRDGALYLNPILVFPEGFVCFDDTELPELVVWLDSSNLEAPPPVDVCELLRRLFGSYPDLETACGAHVDSIKYHQRAERPVPESEEFKPAIAYFFKVHARIPQPQVHEGTERYASRVAGAVLDWPASPYDPTQIEFDGE